jgi:phage shock protein A
MDIAMMELQQKIEDLTKLNAELMANKQAYASAKQSINRMSARLRKLCKRLTPTNEIVLDMQKIAGEIGELVKKI